MQTYTANAANVIGADLVDYQTALPIESGTITHYLRALTGDEAGKYWRASDATWQAVKSSAGAGSHDGEGHWEVTVVAAAWTAGVRYQTWAEADSGRQITVRQDVVQLGSPTNLVIRSEVTS